MMARILRTWKIGGCLAVFVAAALSPVQSKADDKDDSSPKYDWKSKSASKDDSSSSGDDKDYADVDEAALITACGIEPAPHGSAFRSGGGSKADKVVSSAWAWDDKNKNLIGRDFNWQKALNSEFQNPICEKFILKKLNEQKDKGFVRQRCEEKKDDLYNENQDLAKGSSGGSTSFSDVDDLLGSSHDKDETGVSSCDYSVDENAFACAYLDMKTKLDNTSSQKTAAKSLLNYCLAAGANMAIHLTNQQQQSMGNSGLDAYGGGFCGNRGGPIILQDHHSWFDTLVNGVVGINKVLTPTLSMAYIAKLQQQNASQSSYQNYKLGFPSATSAGSGGAYGGYGGGYGGYGGGYGGYGGYGGGYGATGYPGYGYGYGNGGISIGGSLCDHCAMGGGYPTGYGMGGGYPTGYGVGGGIGGYPGGYGGGLGVGGGACAMPPYTASYSGCGGAVGGGLYGAAGGGGIGLAGPYGTAMGGSGYSPFGGGYGGYNPYGNNSSYGAYGPSGMYGSVPFGATSAYNAGAVAQQAQYYQSYASQLARQAQQSNQYAQIYQSNLQDLQTVQNKAYQSYSAYTSSLSGAGLGASTFGGGYGAGGLYGGGSGYSTGLSYYPPYNSSYGVTNGLYPSTGGFSLSVGGTLH